MQITGWIFMPRGAVLLSDGGGGGGRPIVEENSSSVRVYADVHACAWMRACFGVQHCVYGLCA